MIRIALATALILINIFGLAAGQPPSAVDQAFQCGEKLLYRVHYGWVNAGETTFEVKKQPESIGEDDCYHVVGKGYSTGAFDWFFKVRDTYETYFSTQDMLPRRFVRDVDEGGFKIYNEVTFDHDQNKSTSLKGTYNVPDGIHDVLSAVYYFRSIDFNQVGLKDTIPIDIFLDNEVYNIHIQYLGREVISTNLGKFKTFKIKPVLIQGNVFDEDNNMFIWVSDDANKIPIRIQSEILVGSIQADLKQFSGLKNPFTSKLD